jgi:trehalose 6-phosphate synthase
MTSDWSARMTGGRSHVDGVKTAALPWLPSHAGSDVIVLANRAPFSLEPSAGGRIAVTRSASGLVTALEPLVEAHGGTWVAHGSGDSDPGVIGAGRSLNVPPANPRYRIRYVPVPDDEYRGYYYGFANEGLWPLCHDAGVAAVFRPHDFQMYAAANRRFTAAVAEAATPQSLVLVQDYHFALAPRLLRRALPGSTIVSFWHVPWPRVRVLGACPLALELIEGLLGSDVLGFQTRDDCLNFLAGVECFLDAEVDPAAGRVVYRRHSTAVRAYPVGVDWENPATRTVPAAAICREHVRRELRLPREACIGVGIDRLDYTKGIDFKFLAIERLLEQRPELVGRLVFLQVAEPSRDCLPAYQAARTRIREVSDRVNTRFGAGAYRPIHLFESHHEPAEVYRFYRAADFCLVGSLCDGMNLVAKEFVCARDDERGVLVLSEGAGAAGQLRAAVLVNPRDVGRTAQALAQAIDMPAAEQAIRMRVMRTVVRTFSASWWADQLIHDAAQTRRPESAAATPEQMVAEQLSA